MGIVIPNLLSYSDSVVVLDIKQENFRLTAGFRRAHGHAVYLFNPFAEDGRTHRYNPLSVIADGMFRVGDILAIGHVLYPAGGHDEFWKDQARNLLLGLVLLLCDWREARRAGTSGVPDYPITMGEVLRQSSGNGLPVKTYLNRMLIQHRQYLSRACIDALNRFLANDDKVLASILATFNAPLTIWANPIVDAATSANDFDLRDVRRRKMSVYLGVTPDHLSEAAILMNLMFSQLVNLNTKELAEDNPALKYQCLLLLDEMTAIGKIQIIARAVAYMAGYNLRLLSIVQSDSQLESVYGRADARTIVTNHAMQILFAPREQKDANAYSEMLGTRTERSRTTSRSNGMFGARSGASESFSDQRRALMLPQEIKELDRDKEIILLENTRPILADRICYWRDRAFTSRLMAAPTVAALDLVRFGAQIEQRLRELSDDDVDDQTGELAHVRPDYLELVHAWDQRELPQALDNISCEEAAAYVDRHFTLLGVSADDVARAGRRLGRDEDGMTDAEAGSRKRDRSPAARASGGVQ